MTPVAFTPATAGNERMPKFFINRPIVAMVIAILMVLVGAIVDPRLPIAQFPDIVPPEVRRFRPPLPAPTRRRSQQSVATPIEQQMSGVDNMNYMYSINANNGTAAHDRELRRQDRSEHRPRS